MIKPIRNKILVEPIMIDTLDSGIVIPESFKQRGAKARIVAVGNGTKEQPMRIPAGVVCWHVNDAGTEVIDNGVKYYLIDSQDVLGYLPN